MRLHIILLVLISANIGFAKGRKLTQQDIDEARNKLKIYAFSHCLLNQFKDKAKVDSNPILKDIMIAKTSYHFMGTGNYTVLQDDETFKTLYDPYKATEEYVEKVYPTIKGVSRRTGKPVVMINCFKIYNSKEFNDFIKKQDQHIQPSPW